MKTRPMWGTFSCLPGGRGVEENQPNTTNKGRFEAAKGFCEGEGGSWGPQRAFREGEGVVGGRKGCFEAAKGISRG